MSIRATRTPETSARGWKGRDHVRDATSSPWPGIGACHPLEWCNHCTRAWFGGLYQVKVLNVMCDKHGSWVRHG